MEKANWRDYPLAARYFLRESFGLWWWIMFRDGSCIGPMRFTRAHRWADDSPFRVLTIMWSRKTPCGDPEDL